LDRDKDIDLDLDPELEDEMVNSLQIEPRNSGKNLPPPPELDFFPLLKRPFFPGMAAPLVVEPGPFFEVLKKTCPFPTQMCRPPPHERRRLRYL